MAIMKNKSSVVITSISLKFFSLSATHIQQCHGRWLYTNQKSYFTRYFQYFPPFTSFYRFNNLSMMMKICIDIHRVYIEWVSEWDRKKRSISSAFDMSTWFSLLHRVNIVKERERGGSRENIIFLSKSTCVGIGSK